MERTSHKILYLREHKGRSPIRPRPHSCALRLSLPLAKRTKQQATSNKQQTVDSVPRLLSLGAPPTKQPRAHDKRTAQRQRYQHHGHRSTAAPHRAPHSPHSHLNRTQPRPTTHDRRTTSSRPQHPQSHSPRAKHKPDQLSRPGDDERHTPSPRPAHAQPTTYLRPTPPTPPLHPSQPCEAGRAQTDAAPSPCTRGALRRRRRGGRRTAH